MTRALTPRAVAWLIAILAALTVGGALALQKAGYAPCELCLKERIPYYAGIPVALLSAMAVRFNQRQAAIGGFVLLILVFMVSAALGLYHAGVEWKFWAGPTACSGAMAAPANIDDFLRQLNHVTVVRCDQAALSILGLSLTVWNAVISLGLVGLANIGLLKSGAMGGKTPPRNEEGPHPLTDQPA